VHILSCLLSFFRRKELSVVNVRILLLKLPNFLIKGLFFSTGPLSTLVLPQLVVVTLVFAFNDVSRNLSELLELFKTRKLVV